MSNKHIPQRHIVFDRQTLAMLTESSSVINMIEGLPSLDETYLRTYIRESMLTSDPNSVDAYPLAYNGPIPEHLFTEEYITGVLGLEIPLNESQPFSPEFQKRVFEEHVILEGFFSDFKKLGGDMKNAALALRYIFEDPKRIGQYVKAISSSIKELFDKAVAFINDFVENLKVLAEKVGEKIMAGLNKVSEFFAKLKEKLEKLLAGIKGMQGWKQAMLASGALVGLAFAWDKLQEIGGDIGDKLKEVVKFVKEKLTGKGSKKSGPALAKKESYVHTLGLVEAIDPSPEKLNEFLGSIFGKDNKDAEDFGLSVSAGGEVPSDGVLISPEQAKAAGIAGKTPEEAEAEKAEAGGGEGESDGEGGGMMDQVKEKVKDLSKLALEKVKALGADFLKSLGVDFLTAALGGGVMSAFKVLGKAFNGVKFVFQFLGPPLKKFVGMMKGDTDPKEEAEEAAKGIDDPTDPNSAKKDDTKKEAAVRAYVKEKLLAEKKKGLWANIHAKKKRGEKSDPRSKEYQAAKKAGQKINRDAKKEAHHEEAEDKSIEESVMYHLDSGVGFDKNIHRPGSTAFFALFREARKLYRQGYYRPTSLDEIELLEDSDIGEFAYFEGRMVPLDYPVMEGNEEHLNEAEYQGKKVELNKPKRGGDGAYVYVNSGKKTKDGKIKVKKVSFGSSMPDAMGDSESHRKRRKSYGDRHNCSDKDDKTTAGYWSCRATKFFGRNISGWW